MTNKTIRECTLRFIVDQPRLDMIAMRIIWEKDSELWQRFSQKYSELSAIECWDIEVVQQKLQLIYRQNKALLDQARINFYHWWASVEGSWYVFLSDVHNLFENQNMTFTGYIGISPIAPRDLIEESFLIPYYLNKKLLIRLVAHETTHFFFYRKLTELNFTPSDGNIEQSKIIWLISEVLVSLVISDQRSVEIIGPQSRTSYVCQPSLIDKFQPIYNERKEGKLTFSQMLQRLMQVEINDSEVNHKFYQK